MNNIITLFAILFASVAGAQQPTVPAIFTAAQADAGRIAYQNTCGKCHTDTLLGRKGDPGELPPVSSLPVPYQRFIGNPNHVPPLAGKLFLSRWGGKTAAELIARFQITVDDPFFQFQNITDDTTVNITAYVLQKNGAIPGVTPLTRSTSTVVNVVTQAPPTFEVATIKPSAADAETFMQVHPGGRLDVSRATLRALTAFAWRLQPFQVTGGPPWVRSEAFSINARPADNPGEARLLQMLQSLLLERFAMKIHFETKEQPVYLLVVDKNKSPSGIRVTTEESCCGSLGMGANHLEAQDIPMSRLAQALSRVLDRKVLDQTGRTEHFNISLQWTPDEHPTLPSSDAITVPADTPAIATALHEQLGLKLERSKAPMDILVIDHAEMPGAN